MAIRAFGRNTDISGEVDFDTEDTETQAKPNRPAGRLPAARTPIGSSKLGRRHPRHRQPSVFGFTRVTEVRLAGEEHGF